MPFFFQNEMTQNEKSSVGKKDTSFENKTLTDRSEKEIGVVKMPCCIDNNQ